MAEEELEVSVFAKTGKPSRPGPYFVTAIKDGQPHSDLGRPVFYVCDASGFNVCGLLFGSIGQANDLTVQLNGGLTQ